MKHGGKISVRNRGRGGRLEGKKGHRIVTEEETWEEGGGVGEEERSTRKRMEEKKIWHQDGGKQGRLVGSKFSQ